MVRPGGAADRRGGGIAGTVTAVSGAGVVAYRAQAHEDDPERAVRAGSCILSTIGSASKAVPEELSVRVGIETGAAVVGSFGTAGYGAGEVSAAAAVQSAAKAGSVPSAL